MAIGRREFVRNATVGLGAALLARRATLATGVDARIDVLLGETLGTISPNVYGHFAEHLGGVVYDGMWVGEDSKVSNVNGIRKSLVEALRKIKAPVIRWPGGCFADSYDWKDGIGLPAKRPRRTNFWSDEPELKERGNVTQKYDTNRFGTNEFVQFCKLAGSEPYLAANVRGLPASEFDHWVEYCNSPAGSTTLADQRAANGSREPFNVRYWGVGNEAWGCGGQMTPGEYATEFRRFLAWVPRFGLDLSFIASGGGSDDWNWTRGFFEGMVKKGAGALQSVYGLSLHHYAWNLSRGRTQDWLAGKGDALKFDEVDWYELMREGAKIESLIEGHWQVMSEADPTHHVKLIVDEWGPWYKQGTELIPTDLLGQMITLRDAVMSGVTLDIFNRHPEKVAMANCAQLINCLNSLFLAHGDRFALTPVYHVFDMYAVHQGAQALRTIFASPSISYDRDGKQASFSGLQGSASLRDKDLAISVVNPDVSQPREAEIGLRGGVAKSGRVTTLTHSDIHAHNTFDAPDVVRPTSTELKMDSGGLRHVFPPASVTLLQIKLG
ncbi:MAG: alpha-L-arabinofuranosidase AbfB [Candidatus Acidiferrum sp.]